MNGARRYIFTLIFILLIFTSTTIIYLPTKYSAAQVSNGNVSSANTDNTTSGSTSFNSSAVIETPSIGNSTASTVSTSAKVTVSSLPVIKNGTNLSSAAVPIKRLFIKLNPLVHRNLQMALSNIVNAAPPQGTSGQIKVAQETISGFDGLDELQSGGLPPDVQMAAGPNDIAEIVNSEFIVFSKNGNVLSGPVSSNTFFNISSGDSLFDPKILYDSNSGRWFASVGDFTTNVIYLAVSSTNDPTGTWSIYHFTVFQGATYSPDQPILGISDDKVALSVNDFDNNGNFVQSQFDILNKSELVAGASFVHGTIFTRSDFSIHPVQSLSTTTTLYMVNTDGVSNVKLWSVTGVPTAQNPIIATPTTVTLSIGSMLPPPPAVQPGTGAQIDTGDTRILDAAWYQNNLWFTFSDSCTVIGDSQARSCIHLTEINTGSTSISQNFNYDSSGYYYFYPAIRIDSSGNLDVVFGYSSASVYPSIAITGQFTTDNVNTLEQPIAIKVGSGAVTQTDSTGRVRYGDYFAAAVDPSSTSTVWVAGEYISSNVGTIGWSSFISSMTVQVIPSVPTGVTATVASYSSITLSWSASNGATSYTIYRSTSQSGPFTTQVGTSATTSFTDTNLSPQVPYYYEVTATDSVGTSALSSTTSATICLPPPSGDWTVSTSCTLSGNAVASANVIIQPGIVLTIPSGLNLNIDFTHHYLRVHSSGGVLIKSGGKIT